MHGIKMDVSKKVGEGDNKKYEKVGEVEVFYPDLIELGFAGVEPKVLEGKELEEAAGFLRYSDPRHQYVYDAVCAQVRATVRNRLVNGTATLKDGASIPSNIDELLEGGDAQGEAVKRTNAYLASFKAWLPTLGKSAAYNDAMQAYVRAHKLIPAQTAEIKSKILSAITAHAATLKPEDAMQWKSSIDKIGDACKAVNPLDE